jgi:hypothetical protein
MSATREIEWRASAHVTKRPLFRYLRFLLLRDSALRPLLSAYAQAAARQVSKSTSRSTNVPFGLRHSCFVIFFTSHLSLLVLRPLILLGDKRTDLPQLLARNIGNARVFGRMTDDEEYERLFIRRSPENFVEKTHRAWCVGERDQSA